MKPRYNRGVKILFGGVIANALLQIVYEFTRHGSLTLGWIITGLRFVVLAVMIYGLVEVVRDSEK